MAYAKYENVKRLSPVLFNRTDPPKPDDVEAWLDEGAAIINGQLEARGYSTPAGSGADVYPMLRNLNATWGAMMAEYSALTSTGREGNSRAEIFERQFWQRLEKVMKMDLSGMGITHQASVYVGGISESEKESVEDDTDRLRTAFRRGMHSYPGAGTTSARVPSDPQERSD